MEISAYQLYSFLKFLYFLNNQEEMGCQQSRLRSISKQVPLSIVDPAFLKAENQGNRELLNSYNILPKVYINVDCFLPSLEENYTNYVVVREKDLEELQKGLLSRKLNPHIFILKASLTQVKDQNGGTYFSSYDQLPELIEKGKETTKKLESKQKKVDIKILKDFKTQAELQLFIFEETLKVKKITYQFYSTFSELQKSSTKSELILIDYRFHRAAIALGLKSRVICHSELSEEENYDPKVFFITNNFQEVVQEVMIFKQLTQPVLPISKIFFYSTGQKLIKYSSVFQQFGLHVRVYSSLPELLKTTRLYSSLMVICHQEEYAELSNKVSQSGCSFRLRLMSINDETECSARGVRKIIKEVKRGYMVELTASKVVDIIDKFHSGSKFQDLKKELGKKQIEYRCYSSVADYCKRLNYIAPIIICNYDDKFVLHRFLSDAKLRAKIIIYCNKSKINQQFIKDVRWSFVSSEFTKIIKYIKTHHVLFPIIADQNKKVKPNETEAKNKKHRISALKWVGQDSKEKDEAFVVIKNDHEQISESSLALLKLPSSPLENIAQFRENLIASLHVLRIQYKLSISDGEFNELISHIKQANLQELILKSRSFLGEWKEMGIGLNNTLKNLHKLKQSELLSIKEILFLINLNFLGYYSIPFSESTSICCWTKQSSFNLCQTTSLLLSRNFLVMRQQGSVEKLPDCIKLQIDLQYCPLKNLSPECNPYFIFEGRYIFAPNTQLQITQIDSENEIKAIHLKLPKQNRFLQKYFEQNLSSGMGKLFETQLKNTASIIINSDCRQKLQINCERLRAMLLFQANNAASSKKAINMQKTLIHAQEQRENFDSKLITQLKFELANYLTGNEDSQQLLQLMATMKDSSPSLYIKQWCGNKLTAMEKSYQKEGSAASISKSKKCIELKSQIQLMDEESQEEAIPVQENALYQDFIDCLQIDERQGFTQHFP